MKQEFGRKSCSFSLQPSENIFGLIFSVLQKFCNSPTKYFRGKETFISNIRKKENKSNYEYV